MPSVGLNGLQATDGSVVFDVECSQRLVQPHGSVNYRRLKATALSLTPAGRDFWGGFTCRPSSEIFRAAL